jgi:hypothetical protein
LRYVGFATSAMRCFHFEKKRGAIDRRIERAALAFGRSKIAELTSPPPS